MGTNNIAFFDYCKGLLNDYLHLEVGNYFDTFSELSNEFMHEHNVADALPKTYIMVELLNNWSNEIRLYREYCMFEGRYAYDLATEPVNLFEDLLYFGIAKIFEKSSILINNHEMNDELLLLDDMDVEDFLAELNRPDYLRSTFLL